MFFACLIWRTPTLAVVENSGATSSRSAAVPLHFRISPCCWEVSPTRPYPGAGWGSSMPAARPDAPPPYLILVALVWSFMCVVVQDWRVSTMVMPGPSRRELVQPSRHNTSYLGASRAQAGRQYVPRKRQLPSSLVFNQPWCMHCYVMVWFGSVVLATFLEFFSGCWLLEAQPDTSFATPLQDSGSPRVC